MYTEKITQQQQQQRKLSCNRKCDIIWYHDLQSTQDTCKRARELNLIFWLS